MRNCRRLRTASGSVELTIAASRVDLDHEELMGIGGRVLRLITSEDPQKRTMCGQMCCANPSFGPAFFEQFTATTSELR
jgi:hypothetical protein